MLFYQWNTSGQNTLYLRIKFKHRYKGFLCDVISSKLCKSLYPRQPCYQLVSSSQGNVLGKLQKNRRQTDITTYQLLFFLYDTSLCLFGDEMFRYFLFNSYNITKLQSEWQAYQLTHSFEIITSFYEVNRKFKRFCSCFFHTALHKRKPREADAKACAR